MNWNTEKICLVGEIRTAARTEHANLVTPSLEGADELSAQNFHASNLGRKCINPVEDPHRLIRWLRFGRHEDKYISRGIILRKGQDKCN